MAKNPKRFRQSKKRFDKYCKNIKPVTIERDKDGNWRKVKNG